jgi:hypothetical protein
MAVGENAGVAGASAAEQADRLDAKAEQLRRRAERMRKGADGEQRTAELLAPLRADGFVLLHDRAIPNSRANIDHLVIGPTGVWVVDSKNFSGAVTYGNGMVWRGRYPLRDKLETLQWEATEAQRALLPALMALKTFVAPLMCIHGARLPSRLVVVDGVQVARPEDMLSIIRDAPVVMVPGDVADVAALAARALPPKTSAPSSAAAPPRSPGAGRVSTLKQPRSPRRPITRAPQPARTSNKRSTKRQRRRERDIASAIVGLAIVGAFAFGDPFSAAKPATTSASGSVATTEPVAAAPAAAAGAAALAPPPALLGDYTCRPGLGWQFTMRWPGDQAGLGGYQIDWTSSPEKPWINTPLWAPGGQPWALGGLASGSKLFVRGVARAGDEVSDAAMAMFTAPATSC